MSSVTIGHIPEESLLRTLKSMSFKEASSLGIEVRSIEIDHRTSPDDLHLKLLKTLSDWSKYWGTVVDNTDSISNYTYGGASSNGRVLRGRESSTIEYFADFSVRIVEDDGYMQSFTFNMLSQAEMILLRSKRSYSSTNAISMLQIAYGLLKNYDGVIADIRGVVPIPLLPDFAVPM